jgi:hypothetical protein
MPLTPEDIHAAFLKTYKENYQDQASWGVAWDVLSDKEKLCYDRMAELLNEKVGGQINENTAQASPLV